MSRGSRTILLVEDNPDHAELILQGFEDHPYELDVRHVSDGESALDYLYHRSDFEGEGRSPQPGLILLDLRLPRLDGMEVLRELKSNRRLRALPVVILTTSDAHRDMERAYALGANGYLIKPMSYTRFSEMIGILVEYWLKWNRSLF